MILNNYWLLKSFINGNVVVFVVNSYPETRHRYWNGYMLFYEAVNKPTKPNSLLHPTRGPLVRQEPIIEGR